MLHRARNAEIARRHGDFAVALAAAAFACRPGSDLHHLPFPVGPSDLLAAMVSTTVGQTAAAA